MNKHIVISVVLTIALFLSASAVSEDIGRYLQGRQQRNMALKQADRLKQRHRQLMQQAPAIEQAKRFVDHAESVGLVKDRWAYYPIAIEEAITFSAAEDILNQTANSEAYYFKPSMLHIKKTLGQKDAENQDAEGTGKDLLFTLKGSFVVRHK